MSDPPQLIEVWASSSSECMKHSLFINPCEMASWNSSNTNRQHNPKQEKLLMKFSSKIKDCWSVPLSTDEMSQFWCVLGDSISCYLSRWDRWGEMTSSISTDSIAWSWVVMIVFECVTQHVIESNWLCTSGGIWPLPSHSQSRVRHLPGLFSIWNSPSFEAALSQFPFPLHCYPPLGKTHQHFSLRQVACHFLHLSRTASAKLKLIRQRLKLSEKLHLQHFWFVETR